LKHPEDRNAPGPAGRRRTPDPALVLLAALLLACLAAVFRTPFWGDEIAFHVPNARNITIHGLVHPDSLYSSAYGPFPYLVGSLFLRLHDSIRVLRLLNFSVLLLLVLVFYRIARRTGPDPAGMTLLLVSNPYLLRSGFVYYMFNYGLLPAFLGVHLYFFSKAGRRSAPAHALLGLAVLSQQWMLVVVAGLFLLELDGAIRREIRPKDLAAGFGLKIAALLPALLLFWRWHGLTHPAFRAHGLEPALPHLTGALANWGAAVFLVVILSREVRNAAAILPLTIAIPLLALSVPAHGLHPGAGRTTGGASQGAALLDKWLRVPYPVSMALLAFVGLMAAAFVLRKARTDFEIWCKYSLLGFLTAFTAASITGASHVFLSLPFLFFAFSREIGENRKLRNALLVQFYSISLFYVAYTVFFASRGLHL
jgi:hypothetical protein